MAILSITQKVTLQNLGPLTRDGYPTGPGYISGDNDGLYNAACWSWALTGRFLSVANHNSAPYIYENLFKWGNGIAKPPTSVNRDTNSLANQLSVSNPITIPILLNVLDENLANATKGDKMSQNAVRIALLRISAIANGFTLGNLSVTNLVVNGSDVSDPILGDYALHLRSTSWYGWDHWGISILLPNGTRSFVQKVNGSNPSKVPYKDGHVFRNGIAMWDEGMPLTSIAITELLQEQVNIIVAS
ncbi:hypothetical protein [[Flexibacter] sp. ATCC 35103]|uniref:hypothetical protein n=1 Tax=[Flexibacter] sp. ATCC 35103 TaxID=1937528 RepID=UPI0009D4A08F|nr:hypothetical protein [[Flexibacter] sp. ATCC 35103]OMQ08171.1 hypothetical protein BXU01_21980 [[Flexibacter] sp. ATCC 35103]